MNMCRPEMYDSYSSDLAANPIKQKAINHREIQNSMKHLVEISADTNDLVLLIKPNVKITDTAKLLLKTENIEIIRDTSAPITGYYLIDRKTYKKYE